MLFLGVKWTLRTYFRWSRRYFSGYGNSGRNDVATDLPKGRRLGKKEWVRSSPRLAPWIMAAPASDRPTLETSSPRAAPGTARRAGHGVTGLSHFFAWGVHHKNFSTETSGPTGAGGASLRGCPNPQPTSSPEPPPGPSVMSAWPGKHEEWSANKERGRAASKQEEVRIVDIP